MPGCRARRASPCRSIRRRRSPGGLRRFGDPGRVALHERPQRDLLLPRQPAELRHLAAQLEAAALHQGQHLEHAVVHDAGEPGPLLHGRGDPLGPRPRLGRLPQQRRRVADDRRRPAAAGRCCPRWCRWAGRAPTRSQADDRQRGEHAAGPAADGRPGQHRGHHPERRHRRGVPVEHRVALHAAAWTAARRTPTARSATQQRQARAGAARRTPRWRTPSRRTIAADDRPAGDRALELAATGRR